MMLDLSGGCWRRMVGTGGEWVLELSGGHWRRVVGVGAEWSPVEVSDPSNTTIFTVEYGSDCECCWS